MYYSDFPLNVCQFKKIFYWDSVDLQCCSGFRCAAK